MKKFARIRRSNKDANLLEHKSLRNEIEKLKSDGYVIFSDFELSINQNNQEKK